MVATGETDRADAANLNSIGVANALTVDVVTRHDIQSDQTFSGSVETGASTDVRAIDGTAITTSTAMGNSVSVINDAGMDADIAQSAADGSRVSSSAQLSVSSYAMNSVTSATASANAYQSTSYGGDNDHRLRQDSGADVTADGYVLAPTGGLGNSATILGAANGNSARIEGYYMGPDQVVDTDQDNRGDVTARAGADAGGGAVSTQIVSSANGNSVWMQNEYGYARIQGEQNNSGTVTAESSAEIGNFDIDMVSLSSEGVGNSAIISNIGSNAYMGVDQTNTGAVSTTTSLAGGEGGAALLSATSFGNAATTYICAECPVEGWGNTSQVNAATISSAVTGSMTTGNVLTGSATAIGNSATYQSITPHSGN